MDPIKELGDKMPGTYKTSGTSLLNYATKISVYPYEVPGFSWVVSYSVWNVDHYSYSLEIRKKDVPYHQWFRAEDDPNAFHEDDIALVIKFVWHEDIPVSEIKQITPVFIGGIPPTAQPSSHKELEEPEEIDPDFDPFEGEEMFKESEDSILENSLYGISGVSRATMYHDYLYDSQPYNVPGFNTVNAYAIWKPSDNDPIKGHYFYILEIKKDGEDVYHLWENDEKPFSSIHIPPAIRFVWEIKIDIKDVKIENVMLYHSQPGMKEPLVLNEPEEPNEPEEIDPSFNPFEGEDMFKESSVSYTDEELWDQFNGDPSQFAGIHNDHFRTSQTPNGYYLVYKPSERVIVYIDDHNEYFLLNATVAETPHLMGNALKFFKNAGDVTWVTEEQMDTLVKGGGYQYEHNADNYEDEDEEGTGEEIDPSFNPFEGEEMFKEDNKKYMGQTPNVSHVELWKTPEGYDPLPSSELDQYNDRPADSTEVLVDPQTHKEWLCKISFYHDGGVIDVTPIHPVGEGYGLEEDNVYNHDFLLTKNNYTFSGYPFDMNRDPFEWELNSTKNLSRAFVIDAHFGFEVRFEVITDTMPRFPANWRVFLKPHGIKSILRMSVNQLMSDTNYMRLTPDSTSLNPSSESNLIKTIVKVMKSYLRVWGKNHFQILVLSTDSGRKVNFLKNLSKKLVQIQGLKMYDNLAIEFMNAKGISTAKKQFYIVLKNSGGSSFHEEIDNEDTTSAAFAASPENATAWVGQTGPEINADAKHHLDQMKKGFGAQLTHKPKKLTEDHPESEDFEVYFDEPDYEKDTDETVHAKMKAHPIEDLENPQNIQAGDTIIVTTDALKLHWDNKYYKKIVSMIGKPYSVLAIHNDQADLWIENEHWILPVSVLHKLTKKESDEGSFTVPDNEPEEVDPNFNPFEGEEIFKEANTWIPPQKGLSDLLQEAEKICSWRGHAIDWQGMFHGESYSYENGKCVNCGREVYITTKKGIDPISGEAVAVNCTHELSDEDKEEQEIQNEEPKLSYEEAQGHQDFNVGDKVKVLNKAKSFENGWHTTWVPKMNDMIGGVYEIIEIDESDGMLLNNGNGEDFYFPYFVLEIVPYDTPLSSGINPEEEEPEDPNFNPFEGEEIFKESKINELLDKPVPLKIVSATPSEYSALFTVEDIDYETTAFKGMYGLGNTWEINFMTSRGAKEGITGTGNAATVFSTMKVFVDQFIQKYSPVSFKFSAQLKEPSKIKVYNIFAKLLKKKYGYSLQKKEGKDSSGYKRPALIYIFTKSILESQVKVLQNYSKDHIDVIDVIARDTEGKLFGDTIQYKDKVYAVHNHPKIGAYIAIT